MIKTEMRSATLRRVERTLAALLLMFVFSFSAVMAETEPQAEEQADTVSTEDSAETGDGTSQTPETREPAVIKKGKYLYYRYSDGRIRKKAGFVTCNGKKYYVRKGGKVITGKTFKVKKKYYRANKYGIIETGVYKWNDHLYYSYPSGVLRRKEGFVSWKGSRYYVEKGGKIIVNDCFCVRNIPYASDKSGRAEMLSIPDGDGNPVVEVAKKQVGIMTGKTYWVWYYKTRFRDTDITPWCGAFVAWCYNEAGQYKKITVTKKFGSLGYVPSYSRYADKYDKWVPRKKARGGDVIVFGRNRHVGLVEGISGDYIITIEGNAGPTAAIGCKKPGAVIRNVYKINSNRIRGIIRPGKNK